MSRIFPFHSNNLYGIKNEDDLILVNPYFVKMEEEFVNVAGIVMNKATFPDGTYGYLAPTIDNNNVRIFIPSGIPEKFTDYHLSKNGYLATLIIKGTKKLSYFSSTDVGKYGLMDSEQNILQEPYFDYAFSINGYGIWFDKRKNESDDNVFNKIHFLVFCSLEDFLNNRAEIFEDYQNRFDVYLYFDSSINKLIIPNFDKHFNLIQGNNWFFEKGNFGLIANNGKLIIKPSFDMVISQRNGLAIVRAIDFYALLDLSGNQVIPFSNLEIVHDNENVYSQWSNSKKIKEIKITPKKFSG